MTYVRFVQGVIIATPFLIFAYLANNELVPSGTFVVLHAVNERSAFIDPIQPGDRVRPVERDKDGDWVQPIIGDPTYVFVHPQRSFDAVDVDVWFKNTAVPVVAFGGLAQADPDVFDLKPLQNLVTNQSPPERRGNWFVAHVTFDAHVLLPINRTWKFAISTPHIKDIGAEVDIGRMDFTFRRKPLF